MLITCYKHVKILVFNTLLTRYKHMARQESEKVILIKVTDTEQIQHFPCSILSAEMTSFMNMTLHPFRFKRPFTVENIEKY